MCEICAGSFAVLKVLRSPNRSSAFSMPLSSSSSKSLVWVSSLSSCPLQPRSMSQIADVQKSRSLKSTGANYAVSNLCSKTLSGSYLVHRLMMWAKIFLFVFEIRDHQLFGRGLETPYRPLMLV